MSASAAHPQWYVIHTKPREEARARANLQAWGVETLMPCVREPVYYPRRGVTSRVIRALFPQYVFARFDLAESLSKVRFTRGARSVVTVGGVPTAVPDDIIELIRARAGKDGIVELNTELNPGDPVVVRSGLLRGFTGVFQHGQNGSTRVAILLDTLRCQSRVIIERDCLGAVGHAVTSFAPYR